VTEHAWLQDDPVEVPPRPTTDEEIAALPKVEFEQVDDHLYAPDDPFCINCGCLYGEATKHRCGPT
jgi:hypothetical protein